MFVRYTGGGGYVSLDRSVEVEVPLGMPQGTGATGAYVAPAYPQPAAYPQPTLSGIGTAYDMSGATNAYTRQASLVKYNQGR